MFKKIYAILSGYSVALVCLSLLFILTWLSTLEQPEKGLFEVQQRYYSSSNWFVVPDLEWIPKIKGNSVFPPLPSAYLVSAILFVNLLLGGIVRIRKGWKKWGVILAHFSMLGLLISGFVSHHFSKEGIMMVYEGSSSDYAQSYTDYTIEIAQYKKGVKLEPFVVPAKELMGLEYDDSLDASIPALSLVAKVTHWLPNAELKSYPQELAVSSVVKPLALNPQAEMNMAACKVSLLLSGNKEVSFQLHAQSGEQRYTLENGDELGVQLVKEVWKMPFTIHLDRSIGEYHPNTNRPKYFESKVTRLDPDDKARKDTYTIRMNEPMRYEGYTLYQAKWMGDSVRPQSGFAVVLNPADQWPKYCLYLSIVGLSAHFGLQLFRFLFKKKN